jgi:hypothetical protein
VKIDLILLPLLAPEFNYRVLVPVAAFSSSINITGSGLNTATITFLQTLSNELFTCHPLIRRCKMLAIKSIVK